MITAHVYCQCFVAALAVRSIVRQYSIGGFKIRRAERESKISAAAA
jgi:hypothetical protein